VGEHLLCKQGVVGSIPSASTSAFARCGGWEFGRIGEDEIGHGRAWDARTMFSRAVV
jgi:hypothetical protein